MDAVRGGLEGLELKEDSSPRSPSPTASLSSLDATSSSVASLTPVMHSYLYRVYPACILFHIINSKLSEDRLVQEGPDEVLHHVRGIDILTLSCCPTDREFLTKFHDEYLTFMKDLNVPVEQDVNFMDLLPLSFQNEKTNILNENNIHGARYKSVRHLEQLTEEEMDVLKRDVLRLGVFLDKMAAIFSKKHFSVCYNLRGKVHMEFSKKWRQRGARPIDIVVANAGKIASYCLRGIYSTMLALSIISRDLLMKLSCHGYYELFVVALSELKTRSVGAKLIGGFQMHPDGVPYDVSFEFVLVKDDGRQNMEIEYICKTHVSPDYAKREMTSSDMLLTIPFLFEDDLHLKHVPAHFASKKMIKNSEPPFELVSDKLRMISLKNDPKCSYWWDILGKYCGLPTASCETVPESNAAS